MFSNPCLHDIDTKLFFIICQSLGIPVIIEDNEKDLKKCGLNLESSIEKLKIIKKIFENKYVIEKNKIKIMQYNFVNIGTNTKT